MPFYDKRRDSAARAMLRRLFPTREVLGIETREVLLGGGNIHCITQQIPAPRPRGKPAPMARRASRAESRRK
jgi:agmatine deiminase